MFTLKKLITLPTTYLVLHTTDGRLLSELIEVINVVNNPNGTTFHHAHAWQFVTCLLENGQSPDYMFVSTKYVLSAVAATVIDCWNDDDNDDD